MTKTIYIMDHSDSQTLCNTDDYDRLVRRSKWLEYLEDAGINNTSSYDWALDMAREDGFFKDGDGGTEI